MSVTRAILLPLLLVAVAVAAAVAQGAAEVNAVMKDYTLGFGQALEKCREETKLTKEMMEEFMHFWNDDFKFDNRELGCAIICMARHYNLINDDNRMHHENAVKFFEAHPNGALISRETVNLIHECEQRHDSVQDHCWRVVRVAECFKSVCQELGIAPDLDIVVGELIMETTD